MVQNLVVFLRNKAELPIHKCFTYDFLAYNLDFFLNWGPARNLPPVSCFAICTIDPEARKVII